MKRIGIRSNRVGMKLTLAIASALGSASGVRAADRVWNPGGPTDNWNTVDANWDAGSAWTNDDNAIFGGTAEAITVTEPGIVFNDLTFTSGYTLSAGAGSLLLGNDLASAASVATGVTATIAEDIGNNAGGASTLTKTGAGVLSLSGNNSFTGGLTISQGTVSVASNTAIGAGAGAVALDGGTLRTTNMAVVTNTHPITVTANGGTLNIAGAATTGQSSRIITGANTMLGAGTLTIIGTGALNAAGGSGVLVINGANAGYTGNVVLRDGGFVEYGNSAATGVGSTFTLGNNGGLSVVTGIALSNNIVVNGTGSVISFNNNNAGVIAGSVTLNNNVTFGMRDWYNLGTARSGTVTGTITGNHDITVNSGTATGTGGTLTLGGFQATATASNVTLNNAILAVNSNTGTGASSVTRAGNVMINAGGLTVAGTATQSTSDVFGSLSLKSGTGLNFITVTPNAATSTALTFGGVGSREAGSVLVVNGTVGSTPGAANGGNVFFTTAPTSHLIGGGGAYNTSTASIIPWARTTANAFFGYDATRGLVTVSGQVGDLTTAGATDNVADGNGATLTGNRTVNSLIGSGSIVMGGNTLTISSGAIINDVNLVIGSDTGTPGTLDFGAAEAHLSSRNARTLTINSAIIGTGGLTYAGFRTSSDPNLILAGANTYTGATNFYGNGGNTNIRLTNSLALQNSTLNHVVGRGYTMTFGNGGTSGLSTYTFGGLSGSANLNLNNNNATVGAVALTVGGNNESTTYGGVLSSTVAGGSLTKVGTGMLTLTGANTYTGATTVSGGTLRITGSLASPVTVTAGTLDGNGGSVSAAVAVGDGAGTADATLSPGQSVGTLATGSLTFAADGVFRAELNSTGSGSADLVNVTGNLTIDPAATLTLVDLVPGTLAIGTKLTLIDYSGLWNGTPFAGYADGSTFSLGSNGFAIDYDDPSLGGTAVTLTAVVVVPEPMSLGTLAAGGIALLSRRRHAM